MKKGDVMPNGFVLGRGREPLNLTEAQIRYAMKNSKSNSGAARFLNISLTTYEKYSKRYIDSDYSVHQLKNRLLNNSDKVDFKPCCHNCGYDEKRITDGKVPLILDHIDDNWKNHILKNLRFLCYNCFHNLKGNLRGGQPQWRVEQIQKAKETIKSKQKEK